MELSKKHCKACEGDAEPLSHAEGEKLRQEIGSWHMEGDKKIEKTFVFKNFKEALDFVNKVGVIAEAEDHHPDISIFSYKKVKIELTTHSLGGLSENDFILASKINETLPTGRQV